MRILRVIAPALLMLGIWIGISVRDAAAASNEGAPTQQSTVVGTDAIGLHCDGNVCELEVGLGEVEVPALAGYGASIIFEAVQDKVAFLPEGSGIELSDRLVLKMPVGDLEIADAALVIEPGEGGGIERVRGTAQLPLPSFGLLDDTRLLTPVVADVGLEQGKHLMHLGAPLDPERTYLFFNFGAGLDTNAQVEIAGEQQEIGVLIPKGQNATLIIDPLEPFAFLSGDITLSYGDQIALIGQILDPATSMLSMPDQLPLSHRVSAHVEGALSKEWEDAYLELGGGYAVSSGMVGRWLGLEVEPILAQGLLELDSERMLLSGVAGASILPNQVLDSNMQAEIFIPFSKKLQDAYVELAARGSVPAIGLHADGSARLDGALDLVADGSVVTPFAKDDSTAAATEDGVKSDSQSTDRGVIESLSSVAADALERAAAGYEWVAGGVTAGLCDVASIGCEAEAVEVAAAQATDVHAGD